MNKTEFVKNQAQSAHDIAENLQRQVVDTLKEFTAYAERGDMEHILFNIGNLVGKASRVYAQRQRTDAFGVAAQVMDYGIREDGK